MKVLGLIGLVMMVVTTGALAQGTPPKVGTRPIVQVKPKGPTGCKLVGTVRGTKIWAGDCAAAAEMRGSAPETETPPEAAPAPLPGAILPGPRQ
jgi:hypothetical protein